MGLSTWVAAAALLAGPVLVVPGEAAVQAALAGAVQEKGVQEKPKVRVGERQVDAKKEREEAIERAKKHLGKTLRLEPADISLESATATTWPDASLGCPAEDRMYAQVVTPGYKVILEAGGKTHHVHVGRGQVVLCKEPG